MHRNHTVKYQRGIQNSKTTKEHKSMAGNSRAARQVGTSDKSPSYIVLDLGGRDTAHCWW